MTSSHLDWARRVRSVAEDEPQDVVIVGWGVAAHRCAFDLRRGGYRGKLTMLSKEAHAPYDRTLVSKDMLLAGASPEPIGLSDADRYRQAGIDLRLGIATEWLDVHDRCIGTSDGRCVSFDRLVLAVGGVAVLPPAFNADGVLVLRETADVPRLRRALRPGAHVVVVGAGFIGGEVATVAARMGAEVTLLEAAEQPLSAVWGADVGARVADLHRDNGVKLMTGAVVDSVARSGHNFAVTLADAARLEADIVVVAVGMRPNTDWLHGSGIVLDGGVVTDANCRTSADAVFAAGDCARWWHAGYLAFCQVEHWDTANRHGAAIASALLGEHRAFAPLPFFWSDQHGVKFQFAGRPSSFGDVRVEGDGPYRFAARYFVNGELTAVLAANQPRAFAQMRRELLADRWPQTDRAVRKVAIR
jgi:3-phenylpropionate/trans-cinnamate dioxygenase ferredoxin reductase component